MSTPDWVRCVAFASSKTTWCGKSVDERTFASVDQAVTLGKNGRLMICSRCAEQLKSAIKGVSYHPVRKSSSAAKVA